MIDRSKVRIGSIFKLKNFEDNVEITNIFKDKNIVESNKTLVEFYYSNKYENIRHVVRLDDFVNERVKNKAKLNKLDGYYGHGTKYLPYSIKKHLHSTWSHMLERCQYSKVYDKVKVTDKWKSFSHFFDWVMSDESNFKIDDFKNYQLDKDILQWDNEFKEYGPDTCVFIPTTLNKYLAGIIKYKGNSNNLSIHFKNNYIYIPIKYKHLINYYRHYMFNLIINYYFNLYQINEKTFNSLKTINNKVNNVTYIDYKYKLDSTILSEIDKLIN